MEVIVELGVEEEEEPPMRVAMAEAYASDSGDISIMEPGGWESKSR